MRFVQGVIPMGLMSAAVFLCANAWAADAVPAGPTKAASADAVTKKKDDATYKADIAKLRAGDPSVSLHDMRLRHAARYGGYFQGLWMKELDPLFAKSDWKTILTRANAQIDEDYLDLDAHLMAELSSRKLGNEADAKKHHDFIVANINAIRRGRSGNTAAESWEAISVPEEYLVIMLMGYKVVNQSLVHKDGHSYDVMAQQTQKQTSRAPSGLR